jgi:hypothetical protein
MNDFEAAHLICFHLVVVLDHYDLSVLLASHVSWDRESEAKLDSPSRPSASMPGRSECLTSPT